MRRVCMLEVTGGAPVMRVGRLSARHIMRAKVLAAVSGIILVAIFSTLVLTNSRRYSSRVQRLPDGSWLKIVSISYAHTHSYAMPVPNKWQSFLLKDLPSSWTARLGMWWGTGYVSSEARPGETNLGVITVCKQAVPTSLCSSPLIEVCDERGHMYGTALEGPSASNSDGTHHRRLVCWTMDSRLPAHAKKLVLRFCELAGDGKTRKQVAEFIIPNPAVGLNAIDPDAPPKSE